jgi:hypothetical protein
MHITQSNINPLYDILKSIPEEGVVVNHEMLSNIALFFNSGGIVCETLQEVADCIDILIQQDLLSITTKNLISTIKVTKNGKVHLTSN